MLSSSSLYFFSSSITVVKSSYLIPLFIKVSDILISMLFNLLLANIKILLHFFFLSLVVFNSFSIMSVEIENARLKLALAVPASAPITVANDAIEMLQVLPTKQLMTY